MGILYIHIYIYIYIYIHAHAHAQVFESLDHLLIFSYQAIKRRGKQLIPNRGLSDASGHSSYSRLPGVPPNTARHSASLTISCPKMAGQIEFTMSFIGSFSLAICNVCVRTCMSVYRAKRILDEFYSILLVGDLRIMYVYIICM